jgi:hypothetical protein
MSFGPICLTMTSQAVTVRSFEIGPRPVMSFLTRPRGEHIWDTVELLWLHRF